MTIPIRKYEYPKYAKKTIKVKRKVNRNDFKFKVKDKKKVKIRVIKIKENSILTEQSTETMEVEEGEIKANLEKDIIKISVIERHKATGNMSLGFVKGFGIKSGAAASTVAHDSHNIIVIGVSEEDMAKAVNKLIEIGGGMIVVKDGRLLALVELPVAGLISEDEAEVVCRKIEKLKQAWKELECKIKSPFMTMSILALPVIPELRITDKGLIDVTQFKKVSVLMENQFPSNKLK
ncbi:MAG TPA: adenine deaminase, partial [Candidatus Atribacteria bacterium]|nr:adenine deaminase [Candidatus Atribacteria bacterium]